MVIYDLKNSGDFKKLELQAYDGTIDVSRFPPAAYRYFSELKNLYEKYKFENLSRSEAASRKAQLYKDYLETISEYKKFCDVYRTYQENIRKTGTLLSDIEKADNPEDAMILACRVIGLMIGDENFEKRQRRKINDTDKM